MNIEEIPQELIDFNIKELQMYMANNYHISEYANNVMGEIMNSLVVLEAVKSQLDTIDYMFVTQVRKAVDNKMPFEGIL